MIRPDEIKMSTEETGKWGMVIDQDLCTGCQACVAACAMENNITFVGEKDSGYGRSMHWIRIERFWGSGVTFDVRELYVKGVVKDVVRYQVGDVHYKLTPYTFYNNDSELSNYTPGAFSHLLDQVSYDNFYLGDNTWRQQGAAVDFGVVFNKYVQEINWNVFTGRVAATNGGNQPERLFSAANMTLIQSKYVSLGVNYANFYDFPGTASTTEQYVNPVVTGNAQLAYTFGDIALTNYI